MSESNISLNDTFISAKMATCGDMTELEKTLIELDIYDENPDLDSNLDTELPTDVRKRLPDLAEVLGRRVPILGTITRAYNKHVLNSIPFDKFNLTHWNYQLDALFATQSEFVNLNRVIREMYPDKAPKIPLEVYADKIHATLLVIKEKITMLKMHHNLADVCVEKTALVEMHESLKEDLEKERSKTLGTTKPGTSGGSFETRPTKPGVDFETPTRPSPVATSTAIRTAPGKPARITREQLETMTDDQLQRQYMISQVLSTQGNLGNKSRSDRGLPKFTMEKFSGNMADYRLFKSLLETTFEDRGISDREAAYLLYMSLRPEEQSMVQSVLADKLTDESLEIMWKFLDDRFDNPHTTHIIATESLRKFKRIEKVTTLRLQDFLVVLNNVERHYIGKPNEIELTNQYSEIYSKVCDKLPRNFRRKFLVHCQTKSKPGEPVVGCFDTLKSYIEDQIRIAKELDSHMVHMEIPERNRSLRGGLLLKQPKGAVAMVDPTQEESDFESDSDETGYGLEAQTSSAPPQEVLANQGGKVRTKSDRKVLFSDQRKSEFPKSKCFCCNSKEHYVTKCPKFRELNCQLRYKLVKDKGACFHCLNTGHGARTCTFRESHKCGMDGCKRYHHVLLHPDRSVQACYEVCYESEDESEICDQSVNFLSKNADCSLPIVVAYLQSDQHVKPVKVACLLDSGSTYTMIDKNFAMKNDLAYASGFKNYSFGTMNGVRTFKARKRRFTLYSADKLTSQNVVAIETENLDLAFVDPVKLKSKFDHLKDVPFEAPPPDGKVPILIGNNYVHLMKTLTCIDPGKNKGPVAIQTPLGWACSGPIRN